MRAAIVNPYLDTLGGGERYTMAVASTLAGLNYEVDVQWDNSEIKQKLELRFGIKLNNVNFIKDVKRGEDYDVCFWVSDGSVPTLKARNNFLHFQVPFQNVNGKSLMNRMKIFRVKKVICNSKFTKKIIDNEFGVKSVVIYPPVGVDKFKPKRNKENIIMYLGRFSELKQAKKQDVLISVFKKFYKNNKNWKLKLAGGTEIGADKYVKKLEKLAKGYPVEIIKSPDFSKIQDLYGLANVYWSASGFGIDEINNPEAVEHFGISVVEAMAAGAVPIIFNAGGHKEIIKDAVNGFLWNSEDELLTKTNELVKNPKLMKLYQKRAVNSSRRYGYEKFENDFIALL